MSPYRLIFFVALTFILISQIAYAGPASRFALAAARATNNNKIPRSIRAPFRNTEMMTARGFGKRSQQMIGTKYFKDSDYNTPAQQSQQWSYGKRDTKYFDDVQSSMVEQQDPIEQILNEQPVEQGFSIDWFAKEITSNPILAKDILHRFVDTDKDGYLTSNELLATSASSLTSSTQESNDLF